MQGGKKGFFFFIIVIMTRGKNNVCMFVEHVYNGEFMRFEVFFTTMAHLPNHTEITFKWVN